MRRVVGIVLCGALASTGIPNHALAQPPSFIGTVGNIVFKGINGVAANSGDTLYVADWRLGKIHLLGPDGRLVRTWDFTGTGPGQLQHPVDVLVDAAGDVYVSDAGNERILRYRRNGTFVEEFGAPGSGPGQFHVPSGLVMTQARQMYVVEAGNRRVTQLDWSVSPPRFVRALGDSGSGNGQFLWPTGIAIDALGNLYVVDQSACDVQKLAANGDFIKRWGGEGENPPQMLGPTAALVDGALLHVTDSLHGVVQTFDHDGQLLYYWPTPLGSGITVPLRIAFGSSRRLFVSAGDGQRVWVFQQTTPVQPTHWSDIKSAFRPRH